MENSNGHDIIAVGASMGGIEALSRLIGNLPPYIPATIFVVQHIAPGSPGVLSAILGRNTPLVVRPVKDGEPIEHGHVYVAPPDYHLLILDGRVRLLHGPRENRWRPAIDPLFRSVAVAYGSRVVGVVLTGYLDDGTAGLHAIKRCGGVAVVQDPIDAAYGDMPESALSSVDVDYVLPLAEIPALLDRLAREPAGPAPPVPEDIQQEVNLLMMEDARSSDMNEAGAVKTSLVCPECGGVMYEVQGDVIQRFRCHVGHAYTATALLDDQNEVLERALWAGVRTLEDRAMLLEKMARDSESRGLPTLAAEYLAKAKESQAHATQIRRLLVGVSERAKSPATEARRGAAG